MPKGRLLIIGGAEDKGPIRNPPIIKIKNRNYVDYDVLNHLIHRDGGENRIEIITTASQEPMKTGKLYTRSLKRAGFSNVGHISIDNKEELKNPDFLERVRAARVVFFSGGDQYRLTSILSGSTLVEEIIRRYEDDENFLLAGTSAGAMVMSEHMIYHAENNEAMLKGHVRYTKGFGLMKNCVVDTHFVKRGRYGRLFQAVLINPGSYGIGLGEDTGLMIRNGVATCVGSGMVIIVDAGSVVQCNVNEIEDDEPISVENLRLHALTRGDRFHLESGKIELRTSGTVAVRENSAG